MNEVVGEPRPPLARILGLCIQLFIIFGLEKVYEVSRGIVPRQSDVAKQNGLAVVNLEKTLHIFDEWRLQHFVLTPKHWYLGPVTLDRDVIISVINHFYLYSHFISTLVFLGWLYMFRRRSFAFVRTVLIITSALALIVYILFPMMPPRLLGSHAMGLYHYKFQDTIALVLNYKLQQTHLTYNPYAAMPSLHFAWALILGVTLVLIGRHWPLRVVGALYPFMMLATILISGNHLLLDAVGSVLVVAVAVPIAVTLHRRLAPPVAAPSEALAA